MTAAELALERSGPLVSPFTIFAVAVLFAVALLVAAQPRVRVRAAWLYPELGVLATLALLHLLFFWQPYRTEARVPKGGGDLASFFYPMHAFAAREVRDGRLPFWDPHLFSGAPHLANFQAALLYPPNLLSYLIARPFEYATLEQLALLHYLLASWGVYWLARSLGAHRPGSVLAGAIFAYSGFLVAHLGHYSMLATASWMPWVYAAIVASVRRASWGAALGGAFALTCAVLAGHQPMLLMGLSLAVVLATFELWNLVDLPASGVDPGGDEQGEAVSLRDRVSQVVTRERRDALVRLLFIAETALLLALPTLGPSFELTGRTVRGALSYADASTFAAEPIALLHMVVPTVYGSNPTDYWGPFSNTEIWGYAGVLSLFLAALAVATRRSRTTLFWLLVALVALVYAVGAFAPLHGWTYAFVPGFDRVRAAGRALMFVDLAVALLAGFGLDVLTRGRARWTLRERVAVRWGVVALGAALLIVLVVPIPLMASRVLGVNDPGNRPVIALDNLLMLALWLALGLGVAVAARAGILRGSVAVVVVFAVVLLDLFSATAPFNPTTSRVLAGFDHPYTVTFLQERQDEDGPFRIEVTTSRWQPNLAQLAGLDDIGGLFDPLSLADYEAYLSHARADRTSQAYRDLNARYIVGDGEQDPPAGYREAFRASDGIVVWEAPDWMPRAWIEGNDAPVDVDIVSSDAIDITLPGGAAGRLIVSQADYPGWRATVDGRPVDIETCNGALQVIDVPDGARDVRLEFQPTRSGLWISGALLGVLVWVAVAVRLALRHWRRRGGGVSSGVSTEGAAA